MAGFNTPQIPREEVSGAVPVVSADIEATRDGLVYNAAGSLAIETGNTGAVTFVVPDDVLATVTVDMTNANADLTYTAITHGTGGNSITVTHVNPSANDAALAVTVSGTDITVSLATGEAGAITSTATQVVAAIVASSAASALVTCTKEGTGAGIVNAVTKETLAGGANKRRVWLKPPRVASALGPVTATLYEDVTVATGDAFVPRNRLRTGGASRVAITTNVDATLVDGDNDLALDTVILASAGHDYMGGEEDNVWDLGPGNYVLGLLNGNAGTATVGWQLRWTERDPDTM